MKCKTNITIVLYVSACVTFFLIATSRSFADTGDDFHKKTLNITSQELEKCAEKNDSCRIQLGQAYLYGEKTKDGKTTVNIEKANLLLNTVTYSPYARYLKAKLLLWENKSTSGSVRYFEGASLLQSSCSDGVLNACIRAAIIYSGKYNDFKYFSNHPNVNVAEVALQNGLRIIEKKLADLKNKNDDLSQYEKSSLLNEKLTYRKFLGEMLIASGNKRGVEVLEKTQINELEFDRSTLASVYEKGDLVSRDLIKSYMYYDLSGGAFNNDKERVAKEMTRAQINEALERSWQWQEQHRSYRAGYRSPWEYNF